MQFYLIGKAAILKTAISQAKFAFKLLLQINCSTESLVSIFREKWTDIPADNGIWKILAWKFWKVSSMRYIIVEVMIADEKNRLSCLRNENGSVVSLPRVSTWPWHGIRRIVHTHQKN